MFQLRYTQQEQDHLGKGVRHNGEGNHHHSASLELQV
jgi:hypothetical protein